MSHSDAKFEKVSQSDAALYGPRKILLCGFGAGAQDKFKKVLEFANLSDVPRVWAAPDNAETPLAELMARPRNFVEIGPEFEAFAELLGDSPRAGP